MRYALLIEDKAKKELSRLDRPYQRLIIKKLNQLAEDFDSLANNLKQLKGKFDYYRLRVGDYRIIFHRDAKQIIITIIRIGHRNNIYSEF